MMKQKLFIAMGIWGVILGALIIPTQLQLSGGGETVILKTRPVDPRDLLRGDYVILRYDIAGIKDIPGGSSIDLKEEQTVYVTLGVDENNIADAMQVSLKKPGLGKTFIKGTIGGTNKSLGWWRQTSDIDFGIEKYFVPEGKGRTLERARNADNLTVEVSLSKKGRALIKDIFIEGESINFDDIEETRRRW